MSSHTKGDTTETALAIWLAQETYLRNTAQETYFRKLRWAGTIEQTWTCSHEQATSPLQAGPFWQQPIVLHLGKYERFLCGH